MQQFLISHSAAYLSVSNSSSSASSSLSFSSSSSSSFSSSSLSSSSTSTSPSLPLSDRDREKFELEINQFLQLYESRVQILRNNCQQEIIEKKHNLNHDKKKDNQDKDNDTDQDTDTDTMESPERLGYMNRVFGIPSLHSVTSQYYMCSDLSRGLQQIAHYLARLQRKRRELLERQRRLAQPKQQPKSVKSIGNSGNNTGPSEKKKEKAKENEEEDGDGDGESKLDGLSKGKSSSKNRGHSSTDSAAAAAAAALDAQNQSETAASLASTSSSSAAAVVSSLTATELQEFANENELLRSSYRDDLHAVQEAEQRANQVANMIEMFANKITEQQDQIATIVDNTISASVHVQSGVEQLKRASKKGVEFRLIILFIITVLSFSLLFLDWYM